MGIFLLVYAFALRFWLLFGLGSGFAEADYPLLSGALWEWLQGPDWLPPLGTTLLLWIQALLINSLMARDRLAPEINLFPGLFYLLISSALPAFQDFSPFHLANTFLIMAISQLFRVYKQLQCMDHLFNAGLYMGLASLCYPPYFWFLLPVLFGLNILRAFQMREWLAVIIGSMTPLIWLAVIGFWNDRLAERWGEWLREFGFMPLQFGQLSPGNTLGLAAFALLIILLLLNHDSFLQKTVIEVRKKINILYWFLLFGLLATVFSRDLGMAQLLVIGPPAGILLSLIFTRLGRAAGEIVHLLLVIAVLLLHYLTYAGFL